MAAGPRWGSLPSVLIVDILSYLSHEDRLKASSVNKRWRNCLFHPSLWSKIKFQLGFSKRHRSRFLADRCGRFVREAVIKFNAHNCLEVREGMRIITILGSNKNLQHFALFPSSCHIEWPDSNFVNRFLNGIETIVQISRRLRHFSLGCVEELLEHSNHLLQLLSKHHSQSLKHLFLASVKEDSENYGIIWLTPDDLRPFYQLTHLSIDYDYLTNSVLESFVDRSRAKLERLIIHVHGIESTHEKISNATWQMVSAHNPVLEVTINFVHSFDGVESLLDILQPNLPLAHFRQFFCTNLNTAAINYMSTHYRNSLQSVYILDGLMDGYPVPYISQTDEDPFVMLAWRCNKLQNFSLIGYEILEDDVIAIARLRGHSLKSYNIPHCCICTVEEEEEHISWFSHGCYAPEFPQKVSENLKWNWSPIEDDELPLAVFDISADAERAYMRILLSDQQV